MLALMHGPHVVRAAARPRAAAVRQLESAAGVGLQVAIVRVASQASGYRFNTATHGQYNAIENLSQLFGPMMAVGFKISI